MTDLEIEELLYQEARKAGCYTDLFSISKGEQRRLVDGILEDRQQNDSEKEER